MATSVATAIATTIAIAIAIATAIAIAVAIAITFFFVRQPELGYTNCGKNGRWYHNLIYKTINQGSCDKFPAGWSDKQVLSLAITTAVAVALAIAIATDMAKP